MVAVKSGPGIIAPEKATAIDVKKIVKIPLIKINPLINLYFYYKRFEDSLPSLVPRPLSLYHNNRDLWWSKLNNFIDRLIELVIQKRSHIVVGLDPDLSRIPKHIRDESISKFDVTLEAAGEAITTFNLKIIDAVKDECVAVKPQLAFYEVLGAHGMEALRKTVDYAKENGLLVIMDGKRGDVYHTAEQYSKAYLGEIDLWGEKFAPYDADAVTVNPYIGWDGIAPFLEEVRHRSKGIFVLVKTSNPGSGDIQDLHLERDRLFEIVAKQVDHWGSGMEGERGYTAVGAVVGATFRRDAEVLRSIMPNTYFLVPGYGAQGATAEDVASFFNDDGLGAVISSSRSVIFAYQLRSDCAPEEFAEAAKEVAAKMRTDINHSLEDRDILQWEG